MSEIMLWAGFIRDLGLIIGIPVLIAVGVKLYSQHIEILKARNDLLKETQYDRAVTLLESQKKVFLMEREALDKQIADLERLRNEADSKLNGIKQEIEGITAQMRTVVDRAIALNPEIRERIKLEHQKTPPENGS